jgi:hypothetical protein
MRACILIASVCLASGQLGHSQGLVNFANLGNGFNAPVYVDFVGGRLASTGWMAQLILDEQGSLTAVGQPANFIAPGYFNGGVVTVVQVSPGEDGTFRVFAWDSATVATTYAAALAAWNSGLMAAGYSNPVTVATGGIGTPPAPPAALFGLQSWSGVFIPEPSTVLLVLSGATVMLLRRHRNTQMPHKRQT